MENSVFETQLALLNINVLRTLAAKLGVGGGGKKIDIVNRITTFDRTQWNPDAVQYVKKVFTCDMVIPPIGEINTVIANYKLEESDEQTNCLMGPVEAYEPNELDNIQTIVKSQYGPYEPNDETYEPSSSFVDFAVYEPESGYKSYEPCEEDEDEVEYMQDIGGIGNYVGAYEPDDDETIVEMIPEDIRAAYEPDGIAFEMPRMTSGQPSYELYVDEMENVVTDNILVTENVIITDNVVTNVVTDNIIVSENVVITDNVLIADDAVITEQSEHILNPTANSMVMDTVAECPPSHETTATMNTTMTTIMTSTATATAPPPSSSPVVEVGVVEELDDVASEEVESSIEVAVEEGKVPVTVNGEEQEHQPLPPETETESILTNIAAVEAAVLVVAAEMVVEGSGLGTQENKENYKDVAVVAVDDNDNDNINNNNDVSDHHISSPPISPLSSMYVHNNESMDDNQSNTLTAENNNNSYNSYTNTSNGSCNGGMIEHIVLTAITTDGNVIYNVNVNMIDGGVQNGSPKTRSPADKVLKAIDDEQELVIQEEEEDDDDDDDDRNNNNHHPHFPPSLLSYSPLTSLWSPPPKTSTSPSSSLSSSRSSSPTPSVISTTTATMISSSVLKSEISALFLRAQLQATSSAVRTLQNISLVSSPSHSSSSPVDDLKEKGKKNGDCDGDGDGGDDDEQSEAEAEEAKDDEEGDRRDTYSLSESWNMSPQVDIEVEVEVDALELTEGEGLSIKKLKMMLQDMRNRLHAIATPADILLLTNQEEVVEEGCYDMTPPLPAPLLPSSSSSLPGQSTLKVSSKKVLKLEDAAVRGRVAQESVMESPFREILSRTANRAHDDLQIPSSSPLSRHLPLSHKKSPKAQRQSSPPVMAGAGIHNKLLVIDTPAGSLSSLQASSLVSSSSSTSSSTSAAVHKVVPGGSVTRHLAMIQKEKQFKPTSYAKSTPRAHQAHTVIGIGTGTGTGTGAYNKATPKEVVTGNNSTNAQQLLSNVVTPPKDSTDNPFKVILGKKSPPNFLNIKPS
eukprot:gene8949-18511_t